MIAEESPEQRVTALRARGKHYIARKQFQSASDVLTEALELSQSHKLYRLRGIAYASLHRYEDSLQDAIALLQLMPKCADGWYQKGFAHYHLCDYADAAKAFAEGLTLNPGDRLLHQGFWDSMMLMSQARICKIPSRAASDSGGQKPEDDEDAVPRADLFLHRSQEITDNSDLFKVASAAFDIAVVEEEKRRISLEEALNPASGSVLGEDDVWTKLDDSAVE